MKTILDGEKCPVCGESWFSPINKFDYGAMENLAHLVMHSIWADGQKPENKAFGGEIE